MKQRFYIGSIARCQISILLFFLAPLPQEAGERPGCFRAPLAAVLYCAGTGAVKELNPSHPWRRESQKG